MWWIIIRLLWRWDLEHIKWDWIGEELAKGFEKWICERSIIKIKFGENTSEYNKWYQAGDDKSRNIFIR